MKKFVLISLLVAAIGVMLFSGCEKTHTNIKRQIIGEWVSVDNNTDGELKLIFEKNKFTAINTTTRASVFDTDTSYQQKYVIDADTLKLYHKNNNNYSPFTFTLIGDDLSLTYLLPLPQYGGCPGHYYKFKRIN